jgi:SAM-dependent methyltransferase
MYDGSYFGEGRDPLDRMGLSGYERYARDTSNADIAAYLIWRFFAPTKLIDVGCATGFVVEALREIGVDARGSDVSRWAIDHAAEGARGYVQVGDLTARLPFPDASADVVCALETLEHLDPASIDGAVAELARITSGVVIATIPSIGHNAFGPDGFPNAKVLDSRLDAYLGLGGDYDGPVPFEDLAVDATGRPVEGHLTIASYRWWTERFAAAGFRRDGALEARLHPVLARFSLTEFWNLYIFAKPGTPPAVERSAAEIGEVERRWNLADRRPSDRALMFLREGLGDEAVAAALAEPPIDTAR